MAMSLRYKIEGEKRTDNKMIIHKPDLNETETFDLKDLGYSKKRDYFKSGIVVCKKEGLTFSSGIECTMTSEIPIRAGCGSSSAMIVSWIHLLSQMADEPVNWEQQKMGALAYAAEVLEFDEPGGNDGPIFRCHW